MSIKFTEADQQGQKVAGMPVIKVVGLGGGGGNAVNFMKNANISGVFFMCANTDAQALDQSPVEVCIQLGEGGLGAGAMPERGKALAEAHVDEIRSHLQGVDMVFITAGMGGGTGTGSAPVVAKIAREMGILTVGVVSMPFSFERRSKAAQAGIQELAEHVDSLITVPNDKLLKVLGDDFNFGEAFNYANEVLSGAVQGITELVTRPGLINVDFEDLRTVMGERGVAMMGVGHAEGEDRAIKATQKAIANPLLEDIDVNGAQGLLVNITSGNNLTLGEFNQVGSVIDQVADPDATVIIGTSIDNDMTDEVRVTVVATGLKSRPAAGVKQVEINQRRNPAVEAPAVQAEVAPQAPIEQVAMEAPQQPVPQQPVQPVYQNPQTAVPQPAYNTQQTTVTPNYQQAVVPTQPTASANANPAQNPNEFGQATMHDAQQAYANSANTLLDTGSTLDIPAFIRRQLD